MYKGRTIEEAVRKWQNDALHHVSVVSAGLGIDFNLGNKEWTEQGNQAGLFHKSHERDTIEFKGPRTEKVNRKIGDVRPTGDRKNELIVVDQVGPNDYDAVQELSSKIGETTEISHVKSETHGWSITVTAGFEIGGDAQGGKVIGGLELGASGNYSKETADAVAKSIESSRETEVLLPRSEIAEMVQTLQTGEAEADVQDFIVLELGWRVRDWKKVNNAMLKDHSGFGGKERSKSRWHWDCLDTIDFITGMEGVNPRYPGLKYPNGRWGSPFRDWGAVRDSISWLSDEKNRTVLVESKAIFKKGVWGTSLVRCIGRDGKLYAEMTPEQAEDKRRTHGAETPKRDSEYFKDRFIEQHDDD